MNVKRLTILADYLEGVGKFERRGVPKEKFHLSRWMTSYDSYPQIVYEKKWHKKGFSISNHPFRTIAKLTVFDREYEHFMEIEPVECQTAGCAIGWAATIPEFTKDGLCLITSPREEKKSLPGLKNKNNELIALEWEAIDKFFGITPIQSSHLFCPRNYQSHQLDNPNAVAQRIRNLISGDTVLYQKGPRD